MFSCDGGGMEQHGTDQFRAVIVGAGFGGMGAAIQLKRLGIDDFVILARTTSAAPGTSTATPAWPSTSPA
jgi:cation diffusion facilitator CzcD-associated flavoprotein CzcO